MRYYEYEIIKRIEGLPVKAFFVSIDYREYHWHSELELIWVLKGSVDLQLHSGSLRLHKGDVYLVNTNIIHCLKHTEQKNLILALQIHNDIVSGYFNNLGHIIFKKNVMRENVKLSHVIKKNMARVMIGVLGSSPHNKMQAAGYLNLLLSDLVRSVPYEVLTKSSIKHQSYDLERLKRIICYMNQNHQKKLSLQELADNEYISRYRMSHFIKEKLGIGFQELLNHIRLEHAITLIVQTDKNILEISELCGFSDLKYLNRLLKKEYKMTAKTYRDKKWNSLNRGESQLQDLEFKEAIKIVKTYIEGRDYAISKYEVHA